jgi:pilus assembly protein Flp/PilA
MEKDMRKAGTDRLFNRFIRDNAGATAIEYALIACGISIAIVSSVTTLGNNMMTVFYDKLLTLF